VEENKERLDVLGALEAGQIDVQEALRRLDSPGEPPPEDMPPKLGRPWEGLWLIPFGLGLGLIALGGWLAVLGGWWWIGAAAALLLGIPLTILGAVSRASPWVHVRVETGQDSWPRRIVIRLPIRPVAWLLRLLRPHVHGLEDTAVDELLLALDGNVSPGSPLIVEVMGDKRGERVQVYLG
jgi:hypothetical protein